MYFLKIGETWFQRVEKLALEIILLFSLVWKILSPLYSIGYGRTYQFALDAEDAKIRKLENVRDRVLQWSAVGFYYDGIA